MKKRFTAVLCIFIAMTMIMLVADPVWAATSSDLEKQKQQMQQQQKSSQSQLDKANGTVSGIAGQKNAVGDKIDETNADLVEVIANVDLIEDEITQKEDEISQTQKEYDAAKKQEDDLYAAMKERIKFMYEKGDASYVELLMQSSSFSDMVNKAGYVEKLYEYDRQQLKKFVEAQQKALAYQNQLEDEKSELETSQYELVEEKAHMESVLTQYKKQYSDYDVQLAKAQQDAAAYKAQVKQQTAQINALTDQITQKKAEEEAARKAAEEAEAAKKKAAESGNDNNNSGTSSGSRSYSAPGSATGSNVASFATQFVGNPYVPGGTSLTDGADCSGFVWAVYHSFGISVPRTSWALQSAGTEVSYADAQPGDVICYAGHVALYIGNGCIVHASTQRTGIKIGNAAYKPMITVRRILN